MISDLAIFIMLLNEAKSKFGRQLLVNSDFVALSNDITQVTGSYISTTTLKRFWRHKDSTKELTNKIHTSTLNILSRYVGYESFAAYERRERMTPTVTSHRLTLERITINELSPGQRVRLTWAPDRQVVAQYDGGKAFTIISSENSKLAVGDRFEAESFVARCPLLLFNLRQGDEAPSDYICAQNYSLGVELADEQASN